MCLGRSACLILFSEVALFGTDVGTDIVNGYNLIEEGHTIWGTIMCLLTLAPIGIVGPIIVFYLTGRVDNKIPSIFLTILLYVPALPIGTVCYIIFVLVAGVMKAWNPNLSDVDYDIMFVGD